MSHTKGAPTAKFGYNPFSFTPTNLEIKNTHFGGYEEVLGGCLFACCADHNIEDSSLIYRVHSLCRGDRYIQKSV